MKTFKNIIILILLFIYWVVVSAFALKALYSIFFLPIFHTPPISLAQAAGLNVFFAFIFARAEQKSDVNFENLDLDELTTVALALTFSLTLRVVLIFLFSWILLFFI